MDVGKRNTLIVDPYQYTIHPIFDGKSPAVKVSWGMFVTVDLSLQIIMDVEYDAGQLLSGTTVRIIRIVSHIRTASKQGLTNLIISGDISIVKYNSLLQD